MTEHFSKVVSQYDYPHRYISFIDVTDREFQDIILLLEYHFLFSDPIYG